MTDACTRRRFLQGSALTLGGLATGVIPLSGPAFAAASGETTPAEKAPVEKAKVYFTTDLSPAGLRAAYDRVSQPLEGKIAIKLHTGEPGGPNIIPRDWVQSLMADIPNATIVEANVLYSSPRQTTEGHRKVIEENGWTFSPVDILDADGDANLPIEGGQWLKELAVGKNLLNYDSMLVLTHFKGHAMGGFGGSLKNISIGCASGKVGKAQLHREGDQLWSGGPRFMERMVEGGKAITDFFGPRITYINVMRNMSVDCDCAGTDAAAPTAPDIGILASTDILAIDQACVDMIYALPEAQRHDMVERIESRSGLRQLEYMKIMGMGSDTYELITI